MNRPGHTRPITQPCPSSVERHCDNQPSIPSQTFPCPRLQSIPARDVNNFDYNDNTTFLTSHPNPAAVALYSPARPTLHSPRATHFSTQRIPRPSPSNLL